MNWIRLLRILIIQELLLIFFSFFSYGQTNYSVTGEIRGLSSKKIYLSAYGGEKLHPIDSTNSDDKGKINFVLKLSILPGLYRVSWGKDKFLDLILNKENVVFVTTSENPADSVQILSSFENNLYFWYERRERLSQARLELITPIIDYYPVKDAYFTTSANEFESIQKSQAKAFDSLSRIYPDSYAVRILRLQQTPFLSSSLSKDDRVDYLKVHFFDKVDFNDTLLLRSNAWSNKAISYLGLWGNSRYNQKQLETEFIKAVTILMSAASVNPDIYKFLLDYLLGGFDKYHFDEVITYMADHFQDPFSCEDQTKKSALQKKLDTFKKIATGKIAPEITVPDIKGTTIRLSEISSEYTLLIFWSSECHHCTDMMPKVKEIYDKQKPKRMEVLAVSIDTSRSEWTGFIKEEKLDFLNGSELKGFDSKSADQYNIYATPTMFLLDREKKILAKPISYRELEQVLRQNNLMN
jgi:peroxiredoxin